ncbi:cytochrome b [Enterobacter mori]|uniref:cytochrome b n=1 Tax=Enterobacter mori TaxID=539813 RepID=UPI002B214249|nr:cytochrome b/b6 domain-containing protein [Enterobacter mori]MEA5206355.1 cytochrome b/b6 domain-containing protein [Enterobacter mori]
MSSKYAWQQIILHWLSAVIIIWATISGFYVALFDVTPGLKNWMGFFNVSLTTVFIPFFVLRLWYMFRLGKPKEHAPATIATHVAHVAHMALYINISVVLISGVLMMERDINVFHLFILPQPISNLEVTQLCNKIHIFSCSTLGALVLLHILAVIKHELFGKRIMRKMWF